MFVRSRNTRQTDTRDRLIAATIALTPLLLPYYLDYDLLLLAIPAVLFAGERLTRGATARADRWTTRAWVALCVWLYANPASSGMMRLSLTAPLLAAVAAGLVTRALRPNPAAPEMGTGDKTTGDTTTGDTTDEAQLLAMARPDPVGPWPGAVRL
jgi:hypothetical protein